jgi:hypothetical protein
MKKSYLAFLICALFLPWGQAQAQHKCITKTLTGDPVEAKYDFGAHQVEITAGETSCEIEVCADLLNQKQFDKRGFEGCEADPQFYSNFKKIVVYTVTELPTVIEPPVSGCGLNPLHPDDTFSFTMYAQVVGPQNPKVCFRDPDNSNINTNCECTADAFSQLGTDPVNGKSKLSTKNMYWGNLAIETAPGDPETCTIEFLPPLNWPVVYEANPGEVLPVKFTCGNVGEPEGVFSISVWDLDGNQFVIPSNQASGFGTETLFGFNGSHWQYDLVIDPSVFPPGSSFEISVLCQTNNCFSASALIEVKGP